MHPGIAAVTGSAKLHFAPPGKAPAGWGEVKLRAPVQSAALSGLLLRPPRGLLRLLRGLLRLHLGVAGGVFGAQFFDGGHDLVLPGELRVLRGVVGRQGGHGHAQLRQQGGGLFQLVAVHVGLAIRPCPALGGQGVGPGLLWLAQGVPEPGQPALVPPRRPGQALRLGPRISQSAQVVLRQGEAGLFLGAGQRALAGQTHGLGKARRRRRRSPVASSESGHPGGGGSSKAPRSIHLPRRWQDILRKSSRCPVE